MKFRLGIVGCGAIAQSLHIPAVQRHSEMDLCALIDTDLQRAGELAKRYQIPCVSSTLSEVSQELDGVIVATPPHTHHPLLEEAFSRGWHVLCEKPLANSTFECQRLLEAAQKAQRCLAIGHLYRFFPNRQQVRECLQTQTLGRVSHFHLEQGWPAQWDSKTGFSYRKEMVPGGVLLDLGVHGLDLLLWYFGAVKDLEYEDDALGGLESNARLKLSFASGVRGTARFSRTAELSNTLTIHGEKGYLELKNWDSTSYFLFCEGNSQHVVVHQNPWNLITAGHEQLHDFFLSCKTGRPPRTTGQEAQQVMEVIERCYQLKKARPLPSRVSWPGKAW